MEWLSHMLWVLSPHPQLESHAMEQLSHVLRVLSPHAQLESHAMEWLSHVLRVLSPHAQLQSHAMERLSHVLRVLSPHPQLESPCALTPEACSSQSPCHSQSLRPAGKGLTHHSADPTPCRYKAHLPTAYWLRIQITTSAWILCKSEKLWVSDQTFWEQKWTLKHGLYCDCSKTAFGVLPLLSCIWEMAVTAMKGPLNTNVLPNNRTWITG